MDDTDIIPKTTVFSEFLSIVPNYATSVIILLSWDMSRFGIYVLLGCQGQ